MGVLLDMLKRQPTPFVICGLCVRWLRQYHWPPQFNEVGVDQLRTNRHLVGLPAILVELFADDDCRYLGGSDRPPRSQVLQGGKWDAADGLFGY
jgi:hypothetical protein